MTKSFQLLNLSDSNLEFIKFEWSDKWPGVEYEMSTARWRSSTIRFFGTDDFWEQSTSNHGNKAWRKFEGLRLFRLTFRINIDGGTKSKINKSHSQWEYLYAVGKTSDTVATHKDGYRKFDGMIGIFEKLLKDQNRIFQRQ